VSNNIILLTIDALRADHLSCYGYERETTPFLDEFASESWRFENAYSASSHTREAIPAMLAGKHPNDAVGEEFTRGAEIIPMVLPDEYASGAFHSNPYVSRAYGYDGGFDHFYDDLRLGRNKLIALAQRALDKFVLKRGDYHARAEDINQVALEWLDLLPDDQPFFLWNHYMDVHGPYNPPEGYSRWHDGSIAGGKAQRLYSRCVSEPDSIKPSEKRLLKSLYDGEIRYLDEHLESLIDDLMERGHLTDSLLIVAADHGDLFGEHNRFGHPRFLFEELLRVPLVINTSNSGPDEFGYPVSTLDIVPTIFDWIGIPYDDYPGESLLNPNDQRNGRVVYCSVRGENGQTDLCRFGGVHDNLKYVLTRSMGTGEITDEVGVDLSTGVCFDINDTAPGLRRRASNLRTAVIRHSTAQLPNWEAGAESVHPNAEIEQRLEALGYREAKDER
jgi:arylsulfatase